MVKLLELFSGIDFVVMVIAADSGIMPQTREHLRIMKILGIKQGIIALTKADLADEILLELAKEDVRDFVKDTFLENAPIVEVSAKTGFGLDVLKEKIVEITAKIESKPDSGVFRMFVDRVFSVSGFGTVATGSVLNGRLAVGSPLFLLPGNSRDLRVRRIEKYGGEVTEVVAGDRASINIAGMEKSDFRRGMIISDTILRDTKMVDAKLEIFEDDVKLGIWSQVIFHVGTYEYQAKIHLLDKDKVKTGESALIQIHLEEPCVLQYGDRFVIRNTSGDKTLGGGEIIDVSPLHHKRRKDKIIKDIEKLSTGKMSEIIGIQVVKFHRAVTAAELAFSLNISQKEIEELLAKKLPDEIIKYETKNSFLLFTKTGQENIRKGIFKAIQDFRKKNPLTDRGANFDEIRGFIKLEKNSPDEEILRFMLENLTNKEKLREKDKTWLSANDFGDIDQKLINNIKHIEDYMKSCGMQVPLMSVMQEIAAKHKIPEKELKQILHHLGITGAVYRVGEEYIHSISTKQLLIAAAKNW